MGSWGAANEHAGTVQKTDTAERCRDLCAGEPLCQQYSYNTKSQVRASVALLPSTRVQWYALVVQWCYRSSRLNDETSANKEFISGKCEAGEWSCACLHCDDRTVALQRVLSPARARWIVRVCRVHTRLCILDVPCLSASCYEAKLAGVKNEVGRFASASVHAARWPAVTGWQCWLRRVHDLPGPGLGPACVV